MRNLKLLFILICLIEYSCQTAEKTGLEGTKLPSFNLLLLDSSTLLNTESIPPGKPFVMLLFSPYCHFCKNQTKTIVNNMKSLTNINFYFFTTVPLNKIKEYSDRFGLNKHSNITVGQDYDAYFVNYFKPLSIPYMAFYNSDKRLKYVVTGEIGSKTLKNLASNNIIAQ